MANLVLNDFRRWALVPVLVAVAGCSPNSSAVVEPTHGPPALEEADLLAQRLATMRVIERYRRQSEAVYDSLVVVWRARNPNRPAFASGSATGFVPCAPLPFDAGSQIVGSAGGVFQFGPHRLDVPAGALSGPTSIGVMVTSALKSEVVLIPHGLKFKSPVRLTLAYGHCDQTAVHRVAYIDDSDNILEWPSSQDAVSTKLVDAYLTHFSKYAIAY